MIHSIEHDLMRHPLVMEELGIQMQLGLPWLYCRGHNLCLYYKPHREVYRHETLWIYDAQYELGIIYPSRHIIRFVNLYFERNCNTAEPVCEIGGDWMIKEGRQYLDTLYSECSRVLELWEEGKGCEAALLQYQALFKETAAKLGLMALYGEVRQNADRSI